MTTSNYQFKNGVKIAVTVSGNASTQSINDDGLATGLSGPTVLFDGSVVTSNGAVGITDVAGNNANTIYVYDNLSDVIYGGSSTNTIVDDRTTLTGGGHGDVFVGGGGGNKLIDAGTSPIAYSDVLLGGAGKDQLTGGAGSDILMGGAAADLLQIGSGHDQLLYFTKSTSTVGDSSYSSGGPVTTTTQSWDLVQGFRSGVDKFVFDSSNVVGGVTVQGTSLDANLTGSGPPLLEWIGALGTDVQAGATNAGRAHAVWQNHYFVYADLNGDGKADLKIQVATVDAQGTWHGVVLGAADFSGVRTGPAVTEQLAHDTGASSSDGITNNDTLTGTADANAIVTFKEGSILLGSTTADPNGHWSFTPSLPDGVHTIVVSDTDVDGNTGTASLTFTLDTAPPAVTVSLASDSHFSAPGGPANHDLLTGSGDANTLVTVMEGSTVLGTTTSDIHGNWGLTVTLSDGSHTIRASETDLAGNSATATATIVNAPVVSTPAITGTAQEGQTLTASATPGESDDTLTWQWLRGGVAVSGATSSTYAVGEADEGSHLSAVATVTSADGTSTSSATSAATSTVLDALPTITTPVITGTAREGVTLTASASSGQDDNPVTWQWQQDGVNITGATGSTYTATEGNEGHTLDVIATATNDNGVTAIATSAATSSVLDALPTITTPVITGTAREGVTLTASASSGQGDNPITWQWQQDGVNVSGATGSAFAVGEANEGHTIDVIATSHNDNGVATSATSAATGTVIDAAPTVTVSVTGTAQEGQTLTAHAVPSEGDDPVTYQWRQDGHAISGATGSTYAVSESDEGHQITVTATVVTEDHSGTASATSVATAPVIDIDPTLTTPVISGTAREGQTLTATAALANDSDATVHYQWQSSSDGTSWSDIGGDTALTHVVTGDEDGLHLRILATSSDSDGPGTSAPSTATDAVVPDISVIIDGTPQEGQTLTAEVTGATGEVTYQWQSETGTVWTDIDGATGSTFVAREADEGHVLGVVVTPELGTFGARADTSVVIDATPTIGVTVTGMAQEGQTLTAHASPSEGDDTLSYQWQQDGADIAGATGSTYLVEEGDEGHALDVVATATTEDGTGHASATAAATAAVLNGPPTLATLADFSGDNGSFPAAGLIADANGDLFGTTGSGGPFGAGTVFEIAHVGNGYGPVTTLASFDYYGDNGGFPDFGSLIADANGDLFGTTEFGGPPGDGAVFEIAHGPHGYGPVTTLASFDGSNGAFPEAGLIADANGDLFGTTNGDGQSNDGTVFEIPHVGNGYGSLTTLASFNVSNGEFPDAGLIADANGDLFGTTEQGGQTGDGTVFEIAHSGNSYGPVTTLASFDGSNGADPIGGLIADANGDLFGTTGEGGPSDEGTVFEIAHVGNSYGPVTTLASFDGSNGADPVGTLIADANGDLFGTTSLGGEFGAGTVFEIAHVGNAYGPVTTLLSFTGGRPFAGLIADANGDLLGTTINGGQSGAGTVFEVTNTGFFIGCDLCRAGPTDTDRPGKFHRRQWPKSGRRPDRRRQWRPVRHGLIWRVVRPRHGVRDRPCRQRLWLPLDARQLHRQQRRNSGCRPDRRRQWRPVRHDL